MAPALRHTTRDDRGTLSGTARAAATRLRGRVPADRQRCARRSAAPPASTRSASRRPRRSSAPATRSRSARPRACTAAWRSRTATRRASTDPGPCSRAPGDRRRRARLRRRRPARDPTRRARTAGVARYACDDHYERAPRRAAAGRRPPEGATATGRAWCRDDNALVDREAAYRAGLGLVRQERQPAAAGPGLVVRARLGRHRRAAAADDGAGRRRVRRVPPLHRRLPDRGDRRSRRGRRPALPGLAGAAPGHVPARAPGGARRPHLRLRRLPGGVPARTVAAPTRRRRTSRDRATARRGSTVLDLLARRRRHARSSRARPLVHRRPRPSLAAPQRARSCSATSADADDPEVARRSRATSATTTRCCGRTRRGLPAARPRRPAGRAAARRRPVGRAPSCAAPASGAMPA